MAVNKVTAGDEILIDLTKDTVTPADVRTGVTFHMCNGNEAIGTCEMEESTIEDNPSEINKGFVNKVISKNDVLIDLTQDTITPYDVMEGKTFHMRNGEFTIGKIPVLPLDLFHVSFCDERAEYYYINYPDMTNNCIFDIYTTKTENGIYSENIQILPWEFKIMFTLKPYLTKAQKGILSFDYTVESPPVSNVSKYLHGRLSFDITNYKKKDSKDKRFLFDGSMNRYASVEGHVELERLSGIIYPNTSINIKVKLGYGNYLINSDAEAYINGRIKFSIKNIRLDGKLLNLGNYRATFKKEESVSVLDYIYDRFISKEEYPYYIFQNTNIFDYIKEGNYPTFFIFSKNNLLEAEKYGNYVTGSDDKRNYMFKNKEEDKSIHKKISLPFCGLWVTCYQNNYPIMNSLNLDSVYFNYSDDIINNNYDIRGIYTSGIFVSSNPIRY
ncbi:MAG: hypothetical protein PUC73_05440 [Lachnospiraceae bacterium]|nr:hypothetical protein [Lachnospiraceae bacterium]